MGLMNARKLKKARKTFRMNRLPDKKKKLGIGLKFDPIGRASQAKGIVTKKIQKEAKSGNGSRFLRSRVLNSVLSTVTSVLRHTRQR